MIQRTAAKDRESSSQSERQRGRISYSSNTYRQILPVRSGTANSMPAPLAGPIPSPTASGDYGGI
jgi:hypothetical protein